VFGVLSAVVSAGVSLPARQGAGPTLTLSIKNSTAYAQPTPVALATALLVVTPAWEDFAAKSPVGGKEASGQMLFVSDLVVVLSNKEFDCTNVFGPRQMTTDQDVLIVAGRTEAYLPAQGYHTTPVGKIVVDTTGAAATMPVDRFSLDATYTVKNRKSISKENLRGNDAKLVLQRNADGWTADVLLRQEEMLAEGKVPLKSCGLSTRKKAGGAPLLGEKRLQMAVDRFGM
jgi:hypothetical protein